MLIDETSINTQMVRLRGRSLHGERLRASAPFAHWGPQSPVAGLRCHGLTAPLIIVKAMDRIAFDLYVETRLAPTLSRGDVVVLHNLAIHKSASAAFLLLTDARRVCIADLEGYRKESTAGRPSISSADENNHHLASFQEGFDRPRLCRP